MFRKLLFIISICINIILVILLILSYSITENKKEEIEDYAIEYVIDQFNSEKSNLLQNDLVSTGLDFLNQSELKLAEKLNATDSIINQTLTSIKYGELEYYDELKAMNAIDRKKVITINKVESLTNAEFIKRYITMKYIITLEEIPKEVRIFFICNILLFLIIIITTKLRKLSDRVIVYPLILLFLATISSMYIFFFETSWLFKIVFNSYSGYGYLLMVLIIFILLNKLTFESRLISSSISNEHK